MPAPEPPTSSKSAIHLLPADASRADRGGMSAGLVIVMLGMLGIPELLALDENEVAALGGMLIVAAGWVRANWPAIVDGLARFVRSLRGNPPDQRGVVRLDLVGFFVALAWLAVLVTCQIGHTVVRFVASD